MATSESNTWSISETRMIIHGAGYKEDETNALDRLGLLAVARADG